MSIWSTVSRLIGVIGSRKPDAERAEVEVGWRHALAMHNRQMLQEQLADTVREYDTTNDDDVMDRIVELQRLIAISTANEVQLED